MRVLLMTAAAFASVTAPHAFAEVAAESRLQEIDKAQEHWTSSHLSNYAYTLQAGVGPFGFTSVRVKVSAGQCSAVKRFEMGRYKESWKKVPCDGYQMADLYQQLRKALAAGPASYQADFDPALGYIKQASVDPNAEVEDNDWSYYMAKFKVLK